VGAALAANGAYPHFQNGDKPHLER